MIADRIDELAEKLDYCGASGVSGIVGGLLVCAKEVREMSASRLAYALAAYAGPFENPRIGWCGHNSSHPDLFRCERCGQESLDSSEIEHMPDCSAAAILKILAELKESLTPNEAE